MEQAAPILCAGLTTYSALKAANLRPGEFVVIPGAGGGLGHLAVQYANALGYRVIAIDTGAEKRALALDTLGAECFVDFNTSADLVRDVKQCTRTRGDEGRCDGDEDDEACGRGAHAAIVTASGKEAYQQALSYIRPGGTLVAVGLPRDSTIEANVFRTVFEAKRIVGSYVGNRQEAIEALDLAARGKVRAIYATEPLSKLNEVYKHMQEGSLAGRVVLDLNK